MTALEQEAAQALELLKATRGPAASATEQAWAAMQQRLLEGPPALEIGDAAAAAPGDRARWIATGVAVAAVLVAAVGVVSWSAGWLAGAGAREHAEAPYHAPEPDVARPDPAVVPQRAPDGGSDARASSPLERAPQGAAVETQAIEPSAARVNKPRKRDAAAPQAPAVVAPSTTLEAEMRLLAAANASMRAGDPAGALAVLEEHARTFPRGQLAPEREYKRALALCELGRTDKARRVAAAFVDAYPRSPLRGKAEALCREGSEP